MDTLGFIGGGNMAATLIKDIIKSKIYPPENILVSDIKPDRLKFLSNQYHVRTLSDNAELARQVDVLVLSVIPQVMNDVLEGIKGSVSSDLLVISIAAGITTEKITNALGNIAVIRVMSNTPAMISEGASAIFTNDRAKPMLRKAESIFSAAGEVIFVDDENLIDAVTAVSGSGPAYFFLLMEEMSKTAVELGLSNEDAKKLIWQTAKGTSLLASQSDESLTELRERVTSPNGTTAAAIKVFKELGFGDIVNKAIKRAYERSKELSK
ncbi:MAG: pyrroline-5-carboxylate reductase [Sedimentisphaerales bacterium]|nr:pyrroline-5-carboxylate reductase [Sedimentisphaerales bacterium]